MPLGTRWIQLSIVALALVLALGAGACKRNKVPVPSGDIAASLTAPAIGDTAFDPASLKGKPSLVMFVTPTCPHCLATMPRGIAAAQATNANVVAVFVAGGKHNAEGVVSELKFPGPALVDEDGALRKKYEIKGVPYSLVLGPDGRAREAFRGEQDEATFRESLADAR
jgi:cytochrome c biogenesis protein CcmG, thiol:disulfide interchange protein DsbE